MEGERFIASRIGMRTGGVISASEARMTAVGPATGHGIDNVELFWDGKRWWITYAIISVGNVPRSCRRWSFCRN